MLTLDGRTPCPQIADGHVAHGFMRPCSQRLGRKTVSKRQLETHPRHSFRAYDLLQDGSR